MTTRTLILVFLLAGTAVGATAASDNEPSPKQATVSLRKLADSLHDVIAADRETYIEQILEKLPAAGPTKDCPSVPGHAPLLRQAAARIQSRGAEFSYTLRSLAPINANNGPQTQVEQDGLEQVAKTPVEPYYADEELGGRSYFTAVYADRAVRKSCIECHNQHPGSPRHDLKPGDVMGAIVIRIPLEF